MAKKDEQPFDPYREALVLETRTVWPEGLAVPAGKRAALERRLHADPASARQLEYLRLPTGFCRQITVTPDDLARLGHSPSVS